MMPARMNQTERAGTEKTPYDVPGGTVMRLSTALQLMIVFLLASCSPGYADHHSGGWFPLGAFDGGAAHDAASFEAMIVDLKEHGLDTVFLGNTTLAHAGFLTVADRYDFNVIFATADLERSWWKDQSAPTNIDAARKVIYPIVDALKGHRSLRGYYYIDEPAVDLGRKMQLAQQAFHERDPLRPAFPVLIYRETIARLYPLARPPVLVIDVYPYGADNPVCNTAMTGFAYPPDYDMVGYIRDALASKGEETPFWIILQTHRFRREGEKYALRAPDMSEVRKEFWIAIGEGAKGIFWFIYSSLQDWRGLKDDPLLFDEVTDLARRIAPMRDRLLQAHRTADRFEISGKNPYISTIVSNDNAHIYAVAVNSGNCRASEEVAISSRALKGRLRDLETGQIYDFNAPITLGPGDGRIFELTGQGAHAE